ncbi:MAG: nucleotidyl transferase AbiEii/AbiGii toxin family protein [Cyclobacteriaceae bacterium]
MLYVETVESGTFAILKELQRLPQLEGFHLTGGTALALHFGHRKSIDLDLFGGSLSKMEVREAIKRKFTKVEFIDSLSNWSLFCYIDGVKVDIVQYPHMLLCDPISQTEITFYDLPDLSAMKLNAILRRGTKKDFWDIMNFCFISE